MRFRNYNTNIAFIDILFNTIIGITMMFIIAFLLINPIAKKGDIIVNAEFIITMSWPAENNDDMDLYLKDPTGNVVYFRAKDRGLTHLDRDDLGAVNDTINTDHGPIVHQLNEEHITIRGIVEGEYIVNVHWYNKKLSQKAELNNGNEYIASTEVPVQVKVEKLNPYQLIWAGEKIFTRDGEEQTFIRFYVDSEGKVTSINHLSYSLTDGASPNGN